MDSNKISIIIPIYNSQIFLNKCIDSIINQTYKNLEIILVDDGSTDNSLQICKDYAEKDNRIKVIHKENGGQGSARNAGLDVATGDYIGFVDSDDEIVTDMIEFFVSTILKNNLDIIIGKMFTNYNKKAEKTTVEIMNKSTFYPLLLKDDISSHPCNKLFKKELWNDIRFPSRNSVDDMMIMPLLFDRAVKIANTNKNVYWYYCDREDSVSNNPKTMQINSFERFIAFKERYKIAKKNDLTDILPLILNKAVGFAIGAFGRMYKEPERFKDSIAIMQDFFIEYKDEINNNQLLDKKRKIAVTILRKSPKLYYHLLIILKGGKLN